MKETNLAACALLLTPERDYQLKFVKQVASGSWSVIFLMNPLSFPSKAIYPNTKIRELIIDYLLSIFVSASSFVLYWMVNRCI